MVNLVLNWASGVLLIQANQLSDRANETERGSSRRAMFSRCSYEMVIDRRGGAGKPRNSEVDYMTEDVSRRKMLSLLGFGAALGLTLSAALTPFEAEAQEPAPLPLRHPLPPLRKPPGHTGCNDVHRAAAIVVSGAPLAISDGTHAVPVNLLRPPRTRCTSSNAIAINASCTRQKGRRKLMLSSSVSMFVNKRSTVSASQFSRFARGGIRERPQLSCSELIDSGPSSDTKVAPHPIISMSYPFLSSVLGSTVSFWFCFDIYEGRAACLIICPFLNRVVHSNVSCFLLVFRLNDNVVYFGHFLY